MALNEAHAMRPTDADTMLLLSDAHALAGDLQEAANLLQPLIAAHKGKASPAPVRAVRPPGPHRRPGG